MSKPQKQDKRPRPRRDTGEEPLVGVVRPQTPAHPSDEKSVPPKAVCALGKKGRGPAQPKGKGEYSPLALLSQAELARLLNVSVSTLRKMQEVPEFPPRRQFPGGPRGWLYSEIEAYVRNAPAVDSRDED